VDVGGFRLHINCQGTAPAGTPTVVLEHGEGGWSSAWYLIQPGLSKVTQTCAYDRAGLGWSEPSHNPRDARNISTELHILLKKAGVTGPFVLVGYSYGGLYVREYASRYPRDVAGVVLVDATHPDYFTRTAQGRSDLQTFSTVYTVSRLIAPIGILRAVPTPLTTIPSSLPDGRRGEWASLVSPTHYWESTAAEFAATPDTSSEVRASAFPDVPLGLVVPEPSSTAASQVHAQEEADLAHLSSNSVTQVVQRATHASLWDEPNGASATTAVIMRVLAAAAASSRL
jgi:pimeloyl-ACP methyl ester carboxylesterase